MIFYSRRQLLSRRFSFNFAIEIFNHPSFATMTSSTTGSSYNGLINERSPYLLQHATNPVHWHPWCNEAINKAKSENKLIFLSVGYSTCHWCHVMEKESFENRSIAAVMNEHFINIKVDREERPDIDKTYMTFVQLTSGSGGWPMSVFLTPDLYPIAGGTYFPPEDKWNRPGFKTILLKIANQWKNDPDDLRRTGEKVINVLRKASTFDIGIVNELTKGSVPEEECAKVCVHQLSRHFDDIFGGFEIAPKFPQPSNLLLLFNFYAHASEDVQGKSALKMALKTLEMMSKGGIHDHIGQGFARYSTDEKWHVPHFEKMLYDQAQLAMAFAVAFQISKKTFFAEILQDILLYVDRDLSHEKGGFYSAEDADSFPSETEKEKKEGAFYVWKNDEIEYLLDSPLENHSNIKLSDVFKYHYNVKENGNVDSDNDPHGELLDQNVLIVLGSEEKTAEHFGIPIEDLKNELCKARNILFVERNKRPRPHLDSKILTCWNGLMLSGYSKAAEVLRNEDYKNRAIKAATFIKNHLWQENCAELLHCCYVDENGKNIVQTTHPIQGFLNDYAFLIRGLIDLYECTFDSKWIEWCDKLQTTQDRLFWNNTSNVYNMTYSEDHSNLLALKDEQDGAEPAGNSVAVLNLLRLGSYLENEEYKTKAKEILSAYTSKLTGFPASLPEMVNGLIFYHDAATQIFICENDDPLNTKNLLTALQEYYIPNRIIVYVDNDKNSILYRESEIIRKIGGSDRSASAHICSKGICHTPVTSVQDLKSLIENILKKK